jgi:hypothetical protein
VNHFKFLQRAARTDRNAGERRLGKVNRHLSLLPQPVGKAVKPAWPKGGQLDLAEVVVENRFA